MTRSTTKQTSDPTLGRRERAKADKRARILAAAGARLTEHGYDKMTMAQVAEDADVAIGTVFQYAATKPELLMMVTADRWQDTIPTVIAQVGAEADPATVVNSLLRPLIDAAAEDPKLMATVARELLFGADGNHRLEVVALVNDLEQAIAASLARHGAAERSQAAARLIISGGLVELNRTRLGRAPADTVEQRLTAMVAITIAGALAG